MYTQTPSPSVPTFGGVPRPSSASSSSFTGHSAGELGVVLVVASVAIQADVQVIAALPSRAWNSRDAGNSYASTSASAIRPAHSSGSGWNQANGASNIYQQRERQFIAVDPLTQAVLNLCD